MPPQGSGVRTVHLILNRRTRRLRGASGLRARLIEASAGSHVHETSRPEDLRAIAKESAPGDLMLVAGGDGSWLHARSLLSPSRITGLLPCGSMNTFARARGLDLREPALVERMRQFVSGNFAFEAISAIRIETASHSWIAHTVAGGFVPRWFEAYERTRGGPGAAAWLAARAFIVALSQKSPPLFQPAELKVTVGARKAEPKPITLLLATTVEGVGLGFSAGRSIEPATFALVQSSLPPARLAREGLRQLLLGDFANMHRDDLRHVVVEGDEVSLIVDGERLSAPRVTLSHLEVPYARLHLDP